MKVLLIGASGFVGRHMMRRLLADGISFRAAVHVREDDFPDGVDVVRGTRLDEDYNWRPALADCNAVVHLGARVHVMQDTSSDPLAEFRRTNVAGTLNLARQARDAGIGRFVFLSSIKVNGEATTSQPFRESDPPRPLDPYGVSKFEAELGLQELARNGGMSVATIRPPLIYGPGVKGNFLSMLRWLQRGVPLPLRNIENRRSLVGVENLVDLIAVCMSSPAAANQTFLASDGEDISTPALLSRLALALGTRARLLPFPPALLTLLAAAAGQSDKFNRLRESLQVDASHARDRLGWAPPVTLDAGLQRTAEWFLRSSRRS